MPTLPTLNTRSLAPQLLHPLRLRRHHINQSPPLPTHKQRLLHILHDPPLDQVSVPLHLALQNKRNPVIDHLLNEIKQPVPHILLHKVVVVPVALRLHGGIHGTLVRVQELCRCVGLRYCLRCASELVHVQRILWQLLRNRPLATLVI